MDLERLDEGQSEQWVRAFNAGWKAAYRDLANGERVEWCEEHGASSWSDICHIKDGYPSATLGRCRIVSKLLVDYPTEEE